MSEPAAAAASEISKGQIEIVTADISKPLLGLSKKDYDRLAARVEVVYHLAAIYDLAVPLEVAQAVNVDGTGNILDFCAAAKKLERLVYVSTAYVSGRRNGVVYEHELVMGQAFKNHYESTKFQAEAWVRDRMDEIPTVILRPAIVVGDSKTGETQKFDGPYFILRTIAQAEGMGRPVMNFGRSEAAFNVVPVDFIVDSIAVCATDPAAIGETLHLVDPDPVSAAELTATLSREYAGRAPKGRVPPGVVAQSLRSRRVRDRFGGAPRESIVYLNHPVRYDTRNAVRILEPHGLRPPAFGEYAHAMVEFFKQHENDPEFCSLRGSSPESSM